MIGNKVYIELGVFILDGQPQDITSLVGWGIENPKHFSFSFSQTEFQVRRYRVSGFVCSAAGRYRHVKVLLRLAAARPPEIERLGCTGRYSVSALDIVNVCHWVFLSDILGFPSPILGPVNRGPSN
jgi:hypothetical protein